MNRFEKIAWFNLAVLAGSLILFAGLFVFSKAVCPAKNPAFGAFGLWGLWGFGPSIFKRKQKENSPEVHEREQSIQRKALFHGFEAFWIIFTLSMLGIYFYSININLSRTIDVDVLVLILWVGYGIVMLASSISQIIQYRKTARL